MKTTIKHFLSGLGAYPYLDHIRCLQQIRRWVNNGCSGIAPAPVKRKIIMSYLRQYELKVFVETGTHLGDTLANVAFGGSIQSISIELAEFYHQAAQRRFAKYKNVKLLHGDSGKLIPDVVAGLQSPALFWLDGHYSGGLTAKSELHTPVSAELQAILASPIEGHVILIDDVRCFNGTNDYPFLDEFLDAIRSDGRYKTEVSADVLRLTPWNRVNTNE